MHTLHHARKERRQTACKPGSVHAHRQLPRDIWTAIPLGHALQRASRDQPGRRGGNAPASRPSRTAAGHPYSVLLPVGFTLPPPSPGARCALAAPFHPCLQTSRCAGGLFSVALSLKQPKPLRRALPGTFVPWSPDFPRLSKEPRSPNRLARSDMAYCGRGSNSDSNFARHSPSIIPSMRSGRKRRWNAITAFFCSVTS